MLKSGMLVLGCRILPLLSRQEVWCGQEAVDIVVLWTAAWDMDTSADEATLGLLVWVLLWPVWSSLWSWAWGEWEGRGKENVGFSTTETNPIESFCLCVLVQYFWHVVFCLDAEVYPRWPHLWSSALATASLKNHSLWSWGLRLSKSAFMFFSLAKWKATVVLDAPHP